MIKPNQNVKTILRSYRFRMYPNEQQIVLLAKHFGCTRFTYNHFLNEKITQYKETKTSNNCNKQSLELTKLKKQEEYKWLKEVNAQSLQHSLKNLDTAYDRFFKKTSKFPRFKSKKRHQNSFHIPQNVEIKDNKLSIPKFLEGINLVYHRKFNGKIRNATVSQEPSGKYYVSILVEEYDFIPLPKTHKNVGIDLGIKDFAITSDNVKYQNNKYTKKYESKLALAQKHLSRKRQYYYKNLERLKKENPKEDYSRLNYSNSYEKQRRKVAIIYEKIRHCRQDNLHKVSHDLVKNYDIICVENLNVSGMTKNHKLAKHIQDASWSTFITYLEYKCSWNDKKLVKIGKFYPSSRTCNICGSYNEDLVLSDRVWKCENDHIVDRDINASNNILDEGLKILSSKEDEENRSKRLDEGTKVPSAGTVEYMDGETVNLIGENKLDSEKS